MYRTTSLSKRFDAAMFDIYRRPKSEAGYNATKFLQIICERGGLSTAKALINSHQAQDGYTALHQLGRLDLTVEAMIIEAPQWHTLLIPRN